MRSGLLHIQKDGLVNSGIYGHWWSGTAYTYSGNSGINTAISYGLSITIDRSNPSNDGGNRWAGFPLRCLAD